VTKHVTKTRLVSEYYLRSGRHVFVGNRSLQNRLCGKRHELVSTTAAGT